MKKLTTLIIVAVGFSSGCSSTPQMVVIKPEVDISESNVSNNIKVAVQVVDERPDESFGYRGWRGDGATIATDQDVAEIIRNVVIESLKKKGFIPFSSGEKCAKTLKIDIRQIRYEVSQGIWTCVIHTKAALKARATKNGEIYENFYRVENRKRSSFYPYGKEIDRHINDVSSQAIQKLFEDQTLMVFLAR